MVNPTNLIPTPASAWKGKIQVEGTDLLLPSENVARVKQISPQAFLASGMIPDPLTAIIKKSINSKQGMPPKVVEEMLSDPKQLSAAMELFDRVLEHVVVEPAISMPPTCTECGEYFTVDDRHSNASQATFHKYNEGERDPEVMYADQVDLQDKMFIFQWCMGGVRDLDRFREEQSAGLETLSNRKDVRGAAKRTSGRT